MRRARAPNGRAVVALEGRLRRRFRTAETRFAIAGRQIDILHPASAEDLIDEEEFERDERLPYWAEIWPSAKVLAVHVIRLAGRKRALLELGCGAGLVAACAALAGFEVHASDYYDDALAFTRVNVWRQAGVIPRTKVVDWRRLPRDLGTYDIVVASDVLYERPYAELVARTIARCLRPGGTAIVADPGRVGTEDFLRCASDLRLAACPRQKVAFAEGSIRQTIALHTFEAAHT